MFGTLVVTFSDDRTKAFLTLARPASLPDDSRNDYAELVSELSGTHGLTHLKEDVLARVIDDFNERQLGCEKELVADTGQPMKPGKNGYIEWLTGPDPKVVEDTQGRVDFYAVSALKNVAEGESIARLHPPVQGKAGLSVTGEVLTPPPAKEVVYAAGENVEFRPDTGEFFALRNGRIDLVGHTIKVSRVYEVEGDVDFSVGNINFDGFIHVRGNVQDNFVLNAKEGVQIDKVVEAAVIDSGGTLTVIGGMNCRNKGTVRCAGDLITRFLNNAEVFCKGSIRIEKEVLNCKIFAGSVPSPAAMISGGEMVSGGDIDIKEVGSPMGVRTVLQAGRDVFVEKEIEELEKTTHEEKEVCEGLAHKLEAIEPLEESLSAPQKAGIRTLRKRVEKLRGGLEARKTEIEEKKKAAMRLDATVTVRRVIHPGVIVRIGKYEKAINQTFEGYRKFAFDKTKYDIVAHFQ